MHSRIQFTASEFELLGEGKDPYEISVETGAKITEENDRIKRDGDRVRSRPRRSPCRRYFRHDPRRIQRCRRCLRDRSCTEEEKRVSLDSEANFFGYV